VIEVTCALIIDSQNRIFAAQRSSIMSLPLKWEFPGGKIELNETPEHCLLREIKEELNIEVEIVKALPENVHIYPSISIKLMPFICKHVRGEIILREHADFKWLHSNELLALNWADADVPIVKSFLHLLNVST
jgi:8-oxo-dGTP diphosphatase